MNMKLLLLALLLLNTCLGDNIKEILGVVRRVQTTLEHACEKEIYNQQLVEDIRYQVELLKTELQETKQTLEETRKMSQQNSQVTEEKETLKQLRRTSQQNFYSILRLSEQIDKIKEEKDKVEQESHVDKIQTLEEEVRNLKTAFQLLNNEKEKDSKEVDKKFKQYEKEKEEMKQEIQDLKTQLATPDSRISLYSESSEGLSTRVSQMEEAVKKVVENTQEISKIKTEFIDLKEKQSPLYVNEFVWKIENYMKFKHRDEQFFSDSFYVGRGNYAYKMRAAAYLNGSRKGKNLYIKISSQLLNSPYDDILPWPFLGTVETTILSQGNDNNHITRSFEVDEDLAQALSNCYMKFKDAAHEYLPNNEPCGITNHTLIKTAESYPYLVNNTMYIKLSFKIKSLN